MQNYINDGDYTTFYKAIEKVVKARTTVSQLAKDIKIDTSTCLRNNFKRNNFKRNSLNR